MEVTNAIKHTYIQSMLLRFFFIVLFMALLGLRCCAGFSLVVASRDYSLLQYMVSHHGGCSYCGVQALEHTAFSSCST